MKHLLSITDLSRADVEDLFRLAAEGKAHVKAGRTSGALAGRSLALIFEKPSLRTRVTFEVGMTQLGGAAVYLAAQDIAIFDYWLGTTPVSVSAQGHSWLNGGNQDAVFATLRYPDEVLVHLHVSWLNPRKVRHITLVAAQRMLTYDDLSPEEPIRIYDKRALAATRAAPFEDTYAAFRSHVHSGDISIPPVRMGEPLNLECMHFLDCIADGRPPLTGGPQAVAVVETLEAIDRSLAAHGREEPVR